MPAARATSRSDASGCCASSSAARRRPAPLSSGRTRPSRPIRAFDCGISSLELFLMAATVLAARPAEWPMARSDMRGCEAMIRSAAARRSAWDSGRPWVMFSCTARRNTSASLPSKKMTSMLSRPCKDAAIRRCIPSITRMVRRSTRIGGSGVSVSASRAMWALSSPAEPRGVGRAQGQHRDGRHRRAGAARTWPRPGRPPRCPPGSLAGTRDHLAVPWQLSLACSARPILSLVTQPHRAGGQLTPDCRTPPPHPRPFPLFMTTRPRPRHPPRCRSTGPLTARAPGCGTVCDSGIFRGHRNNPDSLRFQ